MKIEAFMAYMHVNEKHEGSMNGFDFYMTWIKQDFISYPVVHFRFEEMITNDMVKSFKPFIKHWGNVTVDPCGYVIHVLCTNLMGNVKEEKMNKFIEAMNQLTDHFKSIPLTNLTHCVICRQEKEELLESHMVNDNLLPVHKTCYDEFKNYHINEVLKDEANTKNYPKSIAFAILGAVVGYLPFLLITVFAGVMLGLLFLLIPLASYYGYKLGKAPLNKKSTIVIMASSIVVIFLGILAYLLLAQKALDTSFANTVVACIGDILFCLIFGILGVVFSYRTITKDTNENKLKKLK